MSKYKHPREIAIEKALEDLDHDPQMAANILKLMTVELALPRTYGNPYYAPEVRAKALKMGALALEREVKEKCSNS